MSTEILHLTNTTLPAQSRDPIAKLLYVAYTGPKITNYGQVRRFLRRLFAPETIPGALRSYPENSVTIAPHVSEL